MNRMYEETKTWNPFVGCLYDCIYCKYSFQAQLKRMGKRCLKCYRYEPHAHPERLGRIPEARIVFVAGDGDISFSPPDYTEQIIGSISRRNRRKPSTLYYFQSKNPKYFRQFLDAFGSNTILLTTLETNRDEGYEKVSKAPKPSQRFKDFLELEYPRKAVTIEPVMDFDTEVFVEWIRAIKPEFVYLGFNSRPKRVNLPEPSPVKVNRLVEELKTFTEVRLKDLRSLGV